MRQHIYVGRFAVMRGLIGGKRRGELSGFFKGLTLVLWRENRPFHFARGLALLKLDSPGFLHSFLGIKWPKFKSIFCLLIIFMAHRRVFFVGSLNMCIWMRSSLFSQMLSFPQDGPLSHFKYICCAFSQDTSPRNSSHRIRVPRRMPTVSLRSFPKGSQITLYNAKAKPVWIVRRSTRTYLPYDRFWLELIYARITLHCHVNAHYVNELLIKHSTIIHWPL